MSKRETPKRLFKPEQADEMLPLVQRIVQDIVEQYPKLRTRVVEREKLNRPAAPAVAVGVKREGVLAQLEGEIEVLARKIDTFVEELRSLGVELKDYERGLVDFPCQLGGRTAYLCWKLGEPSVQFWHDLDSGFTGRKPLPPAAEEVDSSSKTS